MYWLGSVQSFDPSITEETTLDEHLQGVLRDLEEAATLVRDVTGRSGSLSRVERLDVLGFGLSMRTALALEVAREEG